MNAHQEVVEKLIQCESQGKEDAVHKLDGDGTDSINVLQFKYKTFRYYAEKYGIFNGKDFDEADWMNAWNDTYYQKLVASWIIEKDKNWKNNWVVCSKNIN